MDLCILNQQSTESYIDGRTLYKVQTLLMRAYWLAVPPGSECCEAPPPVWLADCPANTWWCTGAPGNHQKALRTAVTQLQDRRINKSCIMFRKTSCSGRSWPVRWRSRARSQCSRRCCPPRRRSDACRRQTAAWRPCACPSARLLAVSWGWREVGGNEQQD